MKKTEIFNYYAFGYDYRLLRYSSANRTVQDVLATLENTLNYFDILDLEVTKKAADGLRKLEKELRKMNNKEKVNLKLATKITEAVDEIDRTLDAELKMRYTYLITPKRYDTKKLVDNIQELFAQNVFSRMPLLAKFDFSEAGKCIAFDLPTAAAFHILRGTEGVLRFYYCSIVKYGRVASLMWGNIIEHLRKRRDAPPKALLDSLDSIRYNERNPTQHPEAKYGIDEVQDLFAVCIDSVNRMFKDLSKRGKIS